MDNAIWLFFAVPEWYFSTIFVPFSAGLLTAIPALGIVCFVVGAIWGVVKRRLGLLAFLILPAASQALVVVAGFMRGAFLHDSDLPGLWAFLMLQMAVAGYFVFRLEGARLPATALAVFTSSYALFAAFVASMALSDMWM